MINYILSLLRGGWGMPSKYKYAHTRKGDSVHPSPITDYMDKTQAKPVKGSDTAGEADAPIDSLWSLITGEFSKFREDCWDFRKDIQTIGYCLLTIEGKLEIIEKTNLQLQMDVGRVQK